MESSIRTLLYIDALNKLATSVETRKAPPLHSFTLSPSYFVYDVFPHIWLPRAYVHLCHTF